MRTLAEFTNREGEAGGICLQGYKVVWYWCASFALGGGAEVSGVALGREFLQSKNLFANLTIATDY